LTNGLHSLLFKCIFCIYNTGRMNASDIVRAKQNQTLYKAYYNPYNFVASAYTYSTISIVSSIQTQSGPLQTSTSYVSNVNTVYTYTCEPTFVSYDMANDINRGAYVCGIKTESIMQWKNLNSTSIYAYSTLYSTIGGPTYHIPSTINVTSTTIMTAPQPLVQPLIQFYQGTNFAAQCNSCQTTSGASSCNVTSGQIL